MHRLVFGYSFADLVAPILLLGLTLYFLNKKKASVCGNADDADSGTYDSLTVLTETNSTGSSSSPTETNNSASSSLTVWTGKYYEVFLSFLGPDTRYNFTDHLYHGLLNAGIHAFRDDDELRQGENIKPELLAAIRNSKISIPIFSVNYGRSSWCLDELVQIMECKNNNGQIVLPVFYKVKPDEVRYQTGRFEEAFNVRKKRSLGRSSFDPAILEKWKKALDEVSNLKGYEADGYEGKLVKSIVRKVLNELKKVYKAVSPLFSYLNSRNPREMFMEVNMCFDKMVLLVMPVAEIDEKAFKAHHLTLVFKFLIACQRSLYRLKKMLDEGPYMVILLM